jgi:peptidyl-prolyl cis-trans isomerase A (cyclophilin A)
MAVVALMLAAGALAIVVSRPGPSDKGSVPPAGTGSIQPTARADMNTSMGLIRFELYGKETPKTVVNFLELAESGYFAGTIFHRVIKEFVAQGGGFTPDLNPKDPGVKPLKLEISTKLKNLRGTIAMARTNEPDSATSQFYINLKDNPALNGGYQGQPGYSVFGKVTSGMDVVDAMANQTTCSQNGMDDVPIQTIMIYSVSISTPKG